MRIHIIIISLILGLGEVYVIRRTKMNPWVALVVWGLAFIIGCFIGMASVALPSLMVAIAIVSCALEDWIKLYVRKKQMTELQRSKIKDL